MASRARPAAPLSYNSPIDTWRTAASWPSSLAPSARSSRARPEADQIYKMAAIGSEQGPTASQSLQYPFFQVNASLPPPMPNSSVAATGRPPSAPGVPRLGAAEPRAQPPVGGAGRAADDELRERARPGGHMGGFQSQYTQPAQLAQQPARVASAAASS